MKNDRRKRRHYLWHRVVFYQALVVVLLVLGTSSVAQAQLVNGDFESGCTGYKAKAFQGGSRCVTGPWFVSHGTPDIYRDQGQGDNPTNCAALWHNGVRQSEGLFVQCPSFIPGRTYRCSFRIYGDYNKSPTNFIVALANGLHHNTNTNSWTFPTGQTAVIIQNITNIPTTNWQTITFDFTPTATFQQLWFYPTSNRNSYIYLDDVTVVEACPAVAEYNNFSGNPYFTEVDDYIRAYGISTVSTGQTITYKAGNYVQLQPNFHAAPGTGFFHAYIGPCSPPPLQPCTDNVIGPIPKHGVGAESLPLPDMGEEVLSNYPNPFTGKTTIQYRVTGSAPVVLEVVNMFGEHVAELLHNETRSAGVHSLEFDVSGLPRGVYYLVLRSGTATATKKIVVIP